MAGYPRGWTVLRGFTLALALVAGGSLVAPGPRSALVGTLGVAPLLAAIGAGLILAAVPAAWGRAASWLALALLGWGASLQLIDAPPRVEYQHLHLAGRGVPHLVALGLLATQAGFLLLAGRGHLGAALAWIVARRRPVGLALGLLVAVAVSAVPSREPRAYLAELVTASVLQLMAALTLVAAARSLPDGAWDRARAWSGRILGFEAPAGAPPRVDRAILVLAGGVTVLTAALAWFAYGGHPHVPDEVVYLLQARYLAEGLLTMPPPPVPAGFHIDLMQYEPDRWYSPVPPGWPAVLALGARVGLPWLVNPVLGGVAIVLAWLVLAEVQTRGTARLSTWLLAASPWFLFMSMNLMTHTLSLVCALGAALGVACSRRSGRWAGALAAGLLAGAVSLVRPLEGLVVAALLGLWSLGARGARFRLAPSAAFGLGVLAVGALVRPYNAMLTGSPSVFPIMAFTDKYYLPGSNALGFGANRGLGWPGLDPFPGHGAIDVVVNTVLNAAQVNVELLGWPVGGVGLAAFGLVAAWGTLRREDAWMGLAIAAVVGAHAFYWFSGGPDFGARYWYLAIVPACALVARGIESLGRTTGDGPAAARGRVVALVLGLAALMVFVPWRATGKYHHYRGMRPDVRVLAREHAFGRSLVLVRGARHPDYASAAIYNPIDLRADAPVYAWDASPEIRAALLAAYPDRPVWILDGPSLTGGAYRVAAGPLSAREAASSPIPPDAAGDTHVYDPVHPPRPTPP